MVGFVEVDVIGLATAAFMLGLVFNAVPGAVFAETVRHGVSGGFRPALAVQLGSLAGDALWAILGLAGVGLLLQVDVLRIPIGVAGVLYMCWLAVDCWRVAGRAPNRTPEVRLAGNALRSGALLSLTNPHNVAYWAALGSALGSVGVHNPQTGDYAIFFGGFMASSIIWCFFCAAMVDRLFRRAKGRGAALTYRLCAVAFLVLAALSFRGLL